MARSSYHHDRQNSMSSSASTVSTLQDPDWKDHFTAAGRPMPKYEPSTWANDCVWGPQAPQVPPFRFTDDSIISVIVRVGEPRTANKKEVVYVSTLPLLMQYC